jgi:cyanate permease
LTPDERSELIETLAEGSGEKSEGNLIAALKDHRVLMLAAIQFGFVLGGYGINMWLPLMLKSRGLGLLEIGRLAVVPYISAMFVLLIWSRIINRFGRPVTNLAIACLLGCTGLAISAHADSVAVEMLGITMASSASVSAVGILWTIPTRFLTGSAAAGGLAFINSVGTLGGFFGPYLVGVLRQTTGTFTAGIWAMSGILAVSAGIAAVLASLVKSR